MFQSEKTISACSGLFLKTNLAKNISPTPEGLMGFISFGGLYFGPPPSPCLPTSLRMTLSHCPYGYFPISSHLRVGDFQDYNLFFFTKVLYKGKLSGESLALSISSILKYLNSSTKRWPIHACKFIHKILASLK